MERKMSIPKVISISLLLIMLPVFGGEGSGFSGTSGVKDMEIWYGGGQLEWKTYLGEHNRTSISTPELCDLNNDGDLEIIVATMNGSIFALDPDGSMFWTEPYMDLEIEALGERNWTGPGNITPVPFFSSPTAVDINPGANPEIVIGGKGKIVCIGADGQKQWNYSIPNSSVFSPVTVTDLEGEFNGSREYWEIVFIADHENGTSSLICLDTTGKENFRYWLGEDYFGLGSAVAISDLDGDFRSNGTSVDPDPGKERSQEMVFSGYGHSLNILGIGYNSSSDEYETYLSIREAGADISSSTPCIVNMDDDREMEIMVLNNYGSEQNSSKGNRSAFDPDGEIVWSNANDSAGSGFFGSPVAADLDNLIRDSGEDYSPDIITVGYDSILRVLNSSNGVEKWNFDTGSPIYSSPAICDINMDLEAEIVVSSSDGKIFMLDGDPTDGIDEGAPYPGDGPEQDVLWVYDTRTEIGISSPVIADIDLDGQLEVVVGDTSGNVYCISTCGFACRGTMDWPTFQGNHNRTGVYSVYITYGVDIYPSVQGPGSRVRSISPLGTIVINLTIENIGKGISVLNRDKIFVKIDQDSIPNNWNARLTTPMHKGNLNPGFVMLASEETADIVLYVEAPLQGEIGEMARINVSVNSSQGEWAEDTVTTLSVLDLYVDFDLFYLKQIDTDPLSDYNGKKWDKINPGAEGLYTMSINNKGDLNDTYEMTLSYPPRDAGWDWYFIETESLTANVSLTAPPLADQFGGITGQALTVKVECPIEAIANTRIPILLKGTSVLSKTSNMEEITKKDELIMVVGSEMDFEMGATQTEMLMLPEDNGTMDFEIILTNTGNTGMYILISAQGIPSGLDVKFSKDPIKLNYSSTVLFPVRVCFPEYLLYDQGDVISLKFFGITEGPRKNISVNITIGRWADLDVEYIGPDPIIIKPGESGNGTVRITNLGNAPEWINASLEGERDSLSLSLSTVEQTSIIQARDHLDIEVTAHAHQDAGSSIGTIYLNITSEISSPVSIPIDVEVVHLHNVSMRLVDGSVKLTDTISPGDARKYVIVIENHGNGPENLDLDIGSQFTGAGNEKVDIASGWEAEFVSLSLEGEGTGKEEGLLTDRIIRTSDLQDGVLYLPNDPYDTRVGPMSMKLLIGPRTSIELVLNVSAPHYNGTMMVEDTTVTLLGELPDMEAFRTIEFKMDVIYPDISFSSGVQVFNMEKDLIEGSTEPGDHVCMFSIENLGLTPSGPFMVILWINGNADASLEVNSLSPGEDRELSIKVYFPEGELEIEIEIDPYNNIYEYKDQFMKQGQNDNNKRALSILVEKESEYSIAFYVMISLWMLLAVLIIAFILIVVASIRKKKDVHEE